MTSDAAEANKTITFADPPSTSNFVSANVPTWAVNDEIMDVAFVKSTGHYPGGPDALKRTTGSTMPFLSEDTLVTNTLLILMDGVFRKVHGVPGK